MAPTHAEGGSAPDPAGGGSSAFDGPELWGNNGVVGDGRYRLTGRLGRGGMAEVFAAEDVRLGRVVAVKLLRADLAEDPVAKARFAREAQAVAGLNHHAVVAVYDSGEDVLTNGETVPFMVMEYVEGRTIRDLLIDADAPPVDQALLIVSGVLEALAYSHQHGIVHRDIKPANVIITNTGAVKVMDFGIARALHGAASTMTQTGMVMGTPQYLSPEQALGRAVDARSDLYATGCLLYELLALRPPFTGDTPLSVVYQHVQDDPKIPSETSDRVPPELDGMVLRALAKEPDDRYQSAEEMRGEIQYALRMLAQEGGHAGTWATGHVGSTPRTDTPTATVAAGSTAVAPMPSGTPPHGTPPLLIAPTEGGGPSGGGRRRRTALVAAAAVVAIGAGVFGALNLNDDGGDNQRAPRGTPSVSTGDGTAKSRAPQDDTTNDTGTGSDDTFAPGTGGEEQQSPAPTWSDPGSSTPSDNSSPQPSASSPQPSESPPPSEEPPPPDPADSGGGAGGGDEQEGGNTNGGEEGGATGG